MKNFILFLLMVVLLPLQSVVSARQAIDHDAGQVIAAAHDYAHNHDSDHANHDAQEHNASGGHGDSEGQGHAHGASIASQAREMFSERSSSVKFGNISREIPSSLPERIERPQWSPAD